jgi:hypothetical protein
MFDVLPNMRIAEKFGGVYRDIFHHLFEHLIVVADLGDQTLDV